MKNRKSLIAMLILFMIIAFIRIKIVTTHELAWDIFGYYVYLPATFIHHDFMLTDISWVHEIMNTHKISDTLYQLSTGPQNNTMYFFLMGMSILYSPFFFVGHLIALATGCPADGFSAPYQYSIALGTLFYTLAGLHYFRKILLTYFIDQITCILIIIIGLGTNYLHFVTYKNLETANLLFTLLAILVWNTIRWHQERQLKNLIAISLTSALITLVKPSEIVCVIIPILWGVYNKETLLEKWKIIVANKKQFFIAIALGLLLLFPQMLYWKTAAGSFIYDSYKNPGIGLDLLSPHILNVLFSFRKGWLLYTPVMIFALIGFWFLYKKNKAIFPAVLIYFLVSFYIISSWTEWWYGAAYGMRPLIPSYVLLSLPLGMLLTSISASGFIKKGLIGIVIGLCLVLNLFQMWQLENFILDPYRTTKDYYFAIFGKIHIDPETRNLLSIERSMSGVDVFHDEQNYNRRNIGNYDYTEIDSNSYKNYVFDTLTHSQVFQLDSSMSFSQNILTTYKGMTDKEYLWIRASVDVFIPEGYREELPVLVTTFTRKEGIYSYKATGLSKDKLKPNQWVKLKLDILTPEVRNVNDHFQAYAWHRGKKPIYIDNFKVDIFETKW
jgi:hypothetical protein